MSDSQGLALVTGASVGIGRDLAIVLAEHRHDLVITARNQTQLEALASELRSQLTRERVQLSLIPGGDDQIMPLLRKHDRQIASNADGCARDQR